MHNLQISTHGNKSRICRLWRHYRVLLWKDYLLRRRGFWLIVAESLFVLIFVVAIAVIRWRYAVDTKPSCYFQSQSMSSMGLLNYIQSLVCNFNYTCNEKNPQSFVTLNGVAPMIYFLDNLTHVVEDPLFNKWLSEPATFGTEQFIDWISLGLKLTRLQTSANNLRIWINDYLLVFKNSSGRQSLEYMSQLICGSPANENDLGRFFIELNQMNMEQDASKSSNNIPIIDHLISQFNNLFDISTLEKMLPEKSLPNLNLCPIIKHLLNSKPFFITMGRLRYFLFGNIAYYPSNQFTDEIIHNMGIYTRILRNIRQLIHLYFNELRPWLLNIDFNNNNNNNQTNLIQIKNQLIYCKDNKFGIIPNELQKLCHYFYDYFIQQNYHNNQYNNNQLNWKLLLNIIDFFMNLFNDLLTNCLQIDKKFIPFNNYNQFHNYLMKQQNNLLSSPIGIIFNQLPGYLNHTIYNQSINDNDNIFKKLINYPNILSITLRNNPLLIYETNHYQFTSKYPITMPNRDPQTEMKYFTSGFIDIQEQLIQSFIYITSIKFNITNIYNQLMNNIGIEMKMFPTTTYNFDPLLINIIFLLPQLMILNWILSIILTVKYMIDEKENRLIDYLRIFNIKIYMNWLAWITISFILMSILSLFIVIILKYGNILPLSNIILIYFIIMNYIISCLFYCIIFTLLNVKSTIASILSGIIYFLLFMPASVLLRHNELPNDISLIPFCFIPQVSYSLCWIFINRLESKGIGAQWSNLWETNNSNSILSLGSSMIFLWIGIILLSVLTFWGIPFIIKCYVIVIQKFQSNCIINHSTSMNNVKKRKKRKVSSGNQLDLSMNTSQLLMNSFQTERQSLINSTIMTSMNNDHSHSIMISPSVIIDNLSKIYQSSKRAALCNINMNFYEDQITVILGRNGAGKTTLLSILVGILKPTQGKIIMHGEVTNKRLDILRKMLGYCPQYDILYNSLTVAEHIHLFGTLKGMSRLSINQKLDDYLQKLGLIDKRNEQTSKLSGGQRRKLSLFLAFLGNSSVIVLDEPTASLDPFSRRAVWDLLKSLRKGRTIILSSHHMYETDLLADQISIISEGKVLCSGSSLSLKSAFGSGYHLSLEMDSLNTNNSSGNNNSFTELLKAIQIHVNDARILSHNANKLIIHLPSCDALTGKFTNLFQQLDNDKFRQLYHIKHYEIANSSLEEVFLSITGDIQTTINNSNDYEYIENYDDEYNGNIEVNHKSNLEEISLMNNNYQKQYSPSQYRNYLRRKPSLLNMIKAMFYKRYIYLKRNKLSWIIEFIFPCLLILTGIGFLEYFKPNNNIQPPMDINHWIMKNAHISNELLHFYTHNTYHEIDSFQSYLKLLNNPLSLTGIGCISSKLHTFQPNINSNCLIQTNDQFIINKNYLTKNCEKYSLQHKFPCYPLATGDILLNLSSIDISDYLMNNSNLLYNIMFGGIEFKTNKYYELNQIIYNLFNKLNNYSMKLNQSNNWKQFLIDLKYILPPKNIIRLWYDNRGYLSSVAYLNLIQNLQYRMLLSNGLMKFNKQYNDIIINHHVDNNIIYPTNSGIIITSHPLPYPDLFENSKMNDDIKADYLLSLFLILALSFIPASFISLPVYERNNNSKHLQILSGLLPSIYWLINYINDYITYLFSSTLCIIIIIIHGNSAYIQSDTIYPFILTIYLYGLAMVSLIYLASFLFKSSSTAFVLICGLNLVIGAVTTFVRFFLEILTLDSVNYQTTTTTTSTRTTQFVNMWLRISPHYCLSGSFFTIALRDFFNKLNIPYKNNNSLWNLLKIDMGCLLLHSLLLFIIVLLLEKQFYIIQIIHWKRNKLKWNRLLNSYVGIHYTDLESNIQTKTEDSSLKPKYAINVKSVCKHYWSQKKPTVEQLNFTVQPGQCYGLLGVNGAGKSTTYSMLTGHSTITHGNIYLNGYDITLNKEKACENIGYCPQQDALCEFMTPRELLTFYSYLRHPNHHHHHHQRHYRHDHQTFNHTNQVNKMIELIGLQQYADCLIHTLSGGNKRKLSSGIAFIGNPKIIFLDEPSTGMDPQGKYLLWNNIKNAIKLNCTILLSSHCMEECELLCNHIGLLIKGKICCHGSPLKLKQQYGLGYYIDLEFKSNILNYINNNNNNINDLQILLHNYLPNFQLRYPLLTRQEYHYNNNDNNKPLWKLFNALDQLNKHNIIENISIRQSTLEDVFVNFINLYKNNELSNE
ncbi:unnamed protein product [Schistosoma intercalatum]|nr:unnamed protein product [Schistosoma intercalatum]CAH8431865.1 unnamed protein product [Schistosoma intercalatum]